METSSSTSHMALKHIEPVKVRSQLYGESVVFEKDKRQIRFTSKFHNPSYLYFDQIEEIRIVNQAALKRKLLWWSLATLLVFVGIFLFYYRVHLPGWKLEIVVKKEAKPVTILARADETQIALLGTFLGTDLDISKHF